MIFDFHNDYITGYRGKKSALDYKNENSFSKIVFAVWTTELKYPEKVIKSCEKLRKKDNGFIYAIEDLGFLTKKNAHILSSARPLYCSLSWNYDNALCGGSNGFSELTPFGREVIGIMSKNNIALDTAHLSKNSFYSACELCENALCSHTGLFSVKESGRNLDFNQIKTIKEKGGIVALSPVASFMRSANIVAFVESIETYADKFGIDSLCIGTDFFGAAPVLGFVSYNDTDRLFVLLQKRGFTAKDIISIFSGNAERYLAKLSKL